MSAESTGSVTPPPRYTSRQGSVALNRYSIGTTDGEESDFRDDASMYEQSVPSSSALPIFASSETESGISWKYANQGLNLITQAHQESPQLSRDDEEGLPQFSRQLYIHGITYLLRGLPADMTPEEILSVQAAIPPQLSSLDPNCQALIPALTRRPQTAPNAPQEEPSILHRITATMILEFCTIMQFLLPYIQLFIGYVYRYERQHRISERIFSRSINTVDEFGRRSVQFTNAICKMNDGKVGQAINDLTVWWVRGVTGGIHQGLSEGVVVLSTGAEANQNSRTRRRKLG